MYKILKRRQLTPGVVELEVYAPLVARSAKPGQFIILRTDKNGERIPLTVAAYKRDQGIVTVIFQIAGATTAKLAEKKAGDYIEDFAGPLGRATELDGLKKVCVIGGGVGCAIALPVASALHEAGCEVTAIIGFRGRSAVILEDEFVAASDSLTVMTDDGSYGKRGLVTKPLEAELMSGTHFDEIFAVGPLIMMKAVVECARPYGMKTTVSMNPIMIDGTGMCGGCRLTVGGKVHFACVDGPDFDGFEVDFDEAMRRSSMYRGIEAHAYGETCNLLARGAS